MMEESKGHDEYIAFPHAATLGLENSMTRREEPIDAAANENRSQGSPKSPGKLSVGAAPFLMPSSKTSPGMYPRKEDLSSSTDKSLNTNAKSFVPRTKLSSGQQLPPAMMAATPMVQYAIPTAGGAGMYPNVMLVPGPQPMISVPVQYAAAYMQAAMQQMQPVGMPAYVGQCK